MTIRLSDLGQVYLVCGKTDMRQGIDSLAYLVKSQFNLDPFSGQVYLFCGGRKDRFKALYWDGQGFWLLYKRFENGKLTWPNNEEEVKAPVPKAPLAHSLGSASIISHTIHQKFNLKVPNYRQEEDWHKLGMPISRKEIANWHIKSSQYYFEPIYNLLHVKLLEQPILHADETSYKVLDNDSQLTFYWTFLSGKHEKKVPESTGLWSLFSIYFVIGRLQTFYIWYIIKKKKAL